MIPNQSLLIYFTDASPIVKGVMLLLLIASIFAWTFILQRWIFLSKARKELQKFESRFWSGIDLSKLYSECQAKSTNVQGTQSIFIAGFREFVRLCKQQGVTGTVVMEGVARAMRIACAREVEKLESHLSFLATVGSTSPYVGLFGTVWGIMTSFHALGIADQATIAMVAPGISEALVATAMGLFAAIPAVIAYNRFTNTVEGLIHQYETFQEEFSCILYRQAHGDLL